MTSEDLSLADSFVLGVLRGFRLLQSAGLSADEKRDILSATKGSLDFSQVSQALQILWDEQFLGRSHQPHQGSVGANYIQEELYYQDGAMDGEWPEHEAYWTGTGPDDGWNDQDWWSDSFEAQAQQQEELGDGSDDAAILEAQKAEQEAEALALQAQRTWSELKPCVEIEVLDTFNLPREAVDASFVEDLMAIVIALTGTILRTSVAKESHALVSWLTSTRTSSTT